MSGRMPSLTELMALGLLNGAENSLGGDSGHYRISDAFADEMIKNAADYAVGGDSGYKGGNDMAVKYQNSGGGLFSFLLPKLLGIGGGIVGGPVGAGLGTAVGGLAGGQGLGESLASGIGAGGLDYLSDLKAEDDWKKNAWARRDTRWGGR